MAKRVCIDGNEAVAQVAYSLSEVIPIYPITPASPMAELADDWSEEGRTNCWGEVPKIVELESEAGAAGSLHGAVAAGALGTTFTASQGLLLMLPNMFKLAGELAPCVIHVASRSVATHALSIFGDHSDVMAVRSSGFGMLASGSVQEAHDLALIAHVATLRSRVPFLHFFDGFRTSHEISTVDLMDENDFRALMDPDALAAHRERGLSPDHPVLMGSAQNPDVFFQSREAPNPLYQAVSTIVQDTMNRLEKQTGRCYHLVDYFGDPNPDRVIVLMGSASGAVVEVVETLAQLGEKVGFIAVRLYRPFPADALVAAIPPTTQGIAVLDRTKESGSFGEPLFLDVLGSIAQKWSDAGRASMPKVIGGRYGLSSKEFTPAMAKAVFDELANPYSKQRFTVGIVDDVTHTSLDVDNSFKIKQPKGRHPITQAVFYGLGSDGTVSANKSAIKIIGEKTNHYAQGYFVYDSKKAGALTVSHLRFGSEPIYSTYLITEADFVACHQFGLLERHDVLHPAKQNATFLLNSPWSSEDVWDHLNVETQKTILDKKLDFWVIDADKLAAKTGLGRRINTIMQPCFFALSGVLQLDQAIAEIKDSIKQTYGKKSHAIVERNWQAVDLAIDEMRRVDVTGFAVKTPTSLTPSRATGSWHMTDFVKQVTLPLIKDKGDELPVSALPADGRFPTGTSKWEKRSIAREIPIWDPTICIDCGKCTIVCPHAAVRMKVFLPSALDGAPGGFLSKDFRSRELPGYRLCIQVSPQDCTGCGVCVEACPVTDKTRSGHKSINMELVTKHLEAELERWEFFSAIPTLDPTLLSPNTVKGSQVRESLFEFSGACAGCGETPYLNLLTQLFGDRIIIANATGCSSIYGGNLPTTPWSYNSEGRGPAWANSLFEDNAEFGLGIHLGVERHVKQARQFLKNAASKVGVELANSILDASQNDDAGVKAQRERVAELKKRLELAMEEKGAKLNGEVALSEGADELSKLHQLSDYLVKKSVWIVGGDGWAYDIGFGGLEHVLASGANVNILVLDTEVYSNTGGQSSKATPRGAIAKFAAGGKHNPKMNLGMLGIELGEVYVAQVAIGANDIQTVKAFIEADAFPGPSLIIAYSSCVPAHGIEESKSMSSQSLAVKSGYWPLYRYHPGVIEHAHPFQLDSHTPSIPFAEYAHIQTRFSMPAHTSKAAAKQLLKLAQADIDEQWRYYEQLAGIERTVPTLPDKDWPGES